MRKTFQYRLYPTKKQLHTLEATLDECRWLYNHLLEKRKTAYEQEGKSLSCYGQQATYPMLKAQRPSLNTVHSQVLQNIAVRLDLAMQAFFRRVKAFRSEHLSEASRECGVDARNKGTGEKPGYPRFKGDGRYDSFTYPQSGFSLTHDNRVSLSKIGSVKLVYHRPLKGTIKTATIHKISTGKWSITFSCECEPERLPERREQVGIDVGLNRFATLSTGEEIENPRFFRREEKALANVQRKHSKRAKGTAERRKHRKRVARVHERVKFKRTNFTHQASRKIVERFGVICVEDLHVSRMLHNHCLAKSISDAAWSQFFSMVSCKAEEAGRVYLAVNPAYTSQTCSACGHRQKMSLSERVYRCPCCSLQLDRDLNAALNIRGLGLQTLGLSVEAPDF
jgi:putative transposase